MARSSRSRGRLPTRAPLARLGLLAVVWGAAVAGAWLGGGGSPASGEAGALTTGGSTVTSGSVDDGRGLFITNCASCHGVQGEGTAAGPSLRGSGEAAADFYLRTGRMPLSAPGQRAQRSEVLFSEEQIHAFTAYVASLGPGPTIPPATAGGGDVGRGWSLFQASCAACHSATGAGNAIGGGFVAVDLANADARTIAEAVLIGPGAMPAFNFDGQSLSDLTAYVQWLRDAPHPGGLSVGGTGPVGEGFIGVAVGLPLLLLIAALVARHGRGTRSAEAFRGGADPARETEPDGR